MIYFTADTHYGHNNIIDYCNRPFDSIEEHDAMLIKNWNNVIGPEDEVYHLGDFAFANNDRIQRITNQLLGKKYFVRGNHDKKRKMPSQWIEIPLITELKISGTHIIMCHYPIESWYRKNAGSWHLHGHSHGKVPSEGIARLDVGVDVHNYTPISYEAIKVLLSK